MKKNILLLMAILLPIIASADDYGSCGDNVFYRYEEATQTLTIEGEGNMTNYDYNHFSPWDSYRSQIKYITIVEGITSIGNRCFYGCEHLKSISLPNTLESIGESSFCGCSDLVTINIPISVSKIGSNAFTLCKSLKSISIPERTTVLEHSVLSKCENIETINLHNNITTIGDWAFDNCKKLKDLTIPSSVTSIGEGAFWCCESLSAIEIPNSVITIGKSAFGFCSEITSIVIPESIEEIKDGTFNGCYKLSSVSIPRNVKFIGKGAFSYCNLINDVYSPDLSAWCKIKFTDFQSNPLHSAKHFYVDNKEITNLIIPEDITSINDYAFYNCNFLTVTIPNTVESIGKSSFMFCSQVESISIPNSVTSIGERAFEQCYKLKSVVLPDNIKYISRGAFYFCRELATITIPSSVEIIYQEAFAYCEKLNEVKAMPETPPTMYDDSFTWYNKTLIVPDESIDLYKSTSPWSKFETIMTISETQNYNLDYYVDDIIYKSYKLKVGEVITPEPAPVKEGHTFSGWSEIPGTMPAHDVTVTGTFTVNKYKLTYKVDGEVYKTYDIGYGATITPEAAPTKVGYTFSGWSNIPATMPAKDVTVTGTFTVNKYKLTYKVDGEVYKTYDVEYGALITPEKEPTKEGYTFSGWSEIPAKMPAKDVTITGSFSVNKYKLTYKVDGEVYKTYDVEFGATITPEPTPTKEGYTFSGWSDIPTTMPAHDVTVSGTFTQETGIVQIMGSENGKAMIFTIDGKRVDNLKKGLNVIRMKDGTIRKAVVK